MWNITSYRKCILILIKWTIVCLWSERVFYTNCKCFSYLLTNRMLQAGIHTRQHRCPMSMPQFRLSKMVNFTVLAFVLYEIAIKKKSVEDNTITLPHEHTNTRTHSHLRAHTHRHQPASISKWHNESNGQETIAKMCLGLCFVRKWLEIEKWNGHWHNTFRRWEGHWPFTFTMCRLNLKLFLSFTSFHSICKTQFSIAVPTFRCVREPSHILSYPTICTYTRIELLIVKDIHRVVLLDADIYTSV